MTGRHRREHPPTSHRATGGHGQWLVQQQPQGWPLSRPEWTGDFQACPRGVAAKAWPSTATQALLAVVPQQRTGEQT